MRFFLVFTLVFWSQLGLSNNGLSQQDIQAINQFSGEFTNGKDSVSISQKVNNKEFYVLLDITVGLINRSVELTDWEDHPEFQGIGKTQSIELVIEPILSTDPDFPDVPGVELELSIKSGKPQVLVKADSISYFFDFDRVRPASYDQHDPEEAQVDFELRQPEESFNHNFFEKLCQKHIHKTAFVDWDKINEEGMECIKPSARVQLKLK